MDDRQTNAKMDVYPGGLAPSKPETKMSRKQKTKWFTKGWTGNWGLV